MTNYGIDSISGGFSEYSIYFLSAIFSLGLPLLILWLTRLVHSFSRKIKAVDYNTVTSLSQSNEASEKMLSDAMFESNTTFLNVEKNYKEIAKKSNEELSDRSESRFFRTATIIFPVFGLAILLIPIVTVLKNSNNHLSSFLAGISILFVCGFVVVAVIYSEKKGDLKWDKQ